MAILVCNLVLNLEILLEFIVIFNHFVSSSFKVVDERTGAFLLESFTIVVQKEVRTVFGSAKGAFEDDSILQF